MDTPDDAHIAKGIEATETWLQLVRQSGDRGIDEIRRTDRLLARLAAKEAALPTDSEHAFTATFAQEEAKASASYAAARKTVALSTAQRLRDLGVTLPPDVADIVRRCGETD
jgi:hypothetical protein